MAAGGYTLVECVVVVAIVGVLATVALPRLQGQGLRAGRLDAVALLTRVQFTQEQYRALHGLYATEPAALKGVMVNSLQGRYLLRLENDGPDGYRATAHAVGSQAQDHDCRAITLAVHNGRAQVGPTPQCWMR
jgi:type IV pilus assembly protein PilE